MDGRRTLVVAVNRGDGRALTGAVVTPNPGRIPIVGFVHEIALYKLHSMRLGMERKRENGKGGKERERESGEDHHHVDASENDVEESAG